MSGNLRILRNGVKIPGLGFGTWQIPADATMKSVIRDALANGFRHFDTAEAYANDYAVAEALAESAISRDEIFFASKLWNTFRRDAVRKGVRRTLKRCSLDYIDLLLIHWPASIALHSDWAEINAETWRVLEDLYFEEKVRAIGVSNFLPHHLEKLAQTARIMPFVNQVEFHPGMPQTETLVFCLEHDILLEAWSPIGTGTMLSVPELMEIAAVKQKSVAQICLRWCIQRGVLPLVKTVKPERMRENMLIFDFTLSDGEMETIDKLPYCGGSGLNPDTITQFG